MAYQMNVKNLFAIALIIAVAGCSGSPEPAAQEPAAPSDANADTAGPTATPRPAPVEPTVVPTAAPDPNSMRDLFVIFAREEVEGWTPLEHAYWCDSLESFDHDGLVDFLVDGYRSSDSAELDPGLINAVADGWTFRQIADIAATAMEMHAPGC